MPLKEAQINELAQYLTSEFGMSCYLKLKGEIEAIPDVDQVELWEAYLKVKRVDDAPKDVDTK